MSLYRRSSPESKRDVVTLARRGDLSIPEVAVDFGVSEESVRRWMRQADVDDGIKVGQTSLDQTELEDRRVSPGRPQTIPRPQRLSHNERSWHDL